MNLLRPLDRYFSVNGLRLHVLDWGGEGRTPLLLLHGFTGHAHAWDTLSIALQPHFHVLALDQRGHGDSDPAEVYNAIAAFDDIGGVVEQLGLTSLVLVGLSMGGRNAIYFTSKRPELIQKLVIVDIGPEVSKRAALAPAGPPEPDTWESIEQAAQHLYRGNPNPGIHYYRWVASSSLRERSDGALVWAWHPSVKERRSQLDIDWWAVLRAITPPTLVLRGESSTVLDRDVAARPLRGDSAGRPHPARGQSRGGPRRAQGVPRLLGPLQLQILQRSGIREALDEIDARLLDARADAPDERELVDRDVRHSIVQGLLDLVEQGLALLHVQFPRLTLEEILDLGEDAIREDAFPADVRLAPRRRVARRARDPDDHAFQFALAPRGLQRRALHRPDS